MLPVFGRRRRRSDEEPASDAVATVPAEQAPPSAGRRRVLNENTGPGRSAPPSPCPDGENVGEWPGRGRRSTRAGSASGCLGSCRAARRRRARARPAPPATKAFAAGQGAGRDAAADLDPQDFAGPAATSATETAADTAVRSRRRRRPRAKSADSLDTLLPATDEDGLTGHLRQMRAQLDDLSARLGEARVARRSRRWQCSSTCRTSCMPPSARA